MPSGDVRGFDVRTGKLLWTFHTIPHKGEMDQAHGSLIQLASEERMSGRQWQLTKSQGESTFLLVPLRVISTEVRDRETDCLEAVLFA